MSSHKVSDAACFRIGTIGRILGENVRALPIGESYWVALLAATGDLLVRTTTVAIAAHARLFTMMNCTSLMRLKENRLVTLIIR